MFKKRKALPFLLLCLLLLLPACRKASAPVPDAAPESESALIVGKRS